MINSEANKMLVARVTVPTTPVWSLPVVLATKKDGKTRFYVGYGLFLQRKTADRWHLSKIPENFDSLTGCNIVTALEPFSGYWLFKTEDSFKECTMLVACNGTYQFEMTPLR